MLNLCLSDWLSKLEALHPTEIDLGLQRIKTVAGRLSLPSIANKVITVAGTNGKGSTVRLLNELLSPSGYRVGSYTSPHIQHYNERISIDGAYVTDADLCTAFEQIESARGDISLTYFEFGTLAAFTLFARAELDVAILEVGLGGRLDAVNIIDPDVAILTTIALDHQDWLGTTREEIGFEKAGIFRADTPAVCGDSNIPSPVIDYADAISAQLICINRDYGYEVAQNQIAEKRCNFWGINQAVEESTASDNTYQYSDLAFPALPVMNAATAIQAIHQLGLPVTREAINTAMNANLPGRYQRIKRGYTLILDVAHNPEAATYLYRKLSDEKIEGKIHAMLGMLADKDSDKILQTFTPIIDSWAVADLNTPRAQTAKMLEQELLPLTDKPIQLYKTVSNGLSVLDKQLGKEDILLVFGSFYTVNDALEWLEVRV